MTRNPPRVLLTGIGLMAPFGPFGRGREASWRSLREGRCHPITVRPEGRPDDPPSHFFTAPYRDRFRPGFDPWPALLADCTREALADAGLDPPILFADRIGVVVGLSKGRVHALESLASDIRKDGDCLEAVRHWPALWPDSGAGSVRQIVGGSGPTLAPVAACATGLVAAIRGAGLIRRGECDLAIVGAVDASATPFILGAFRRMRALAEPPVVRPWSRRRSGFLVGEGGALLVLEREEHARERGIGAYAEFAGGVLGSDARHMTDLDPDPTNLAALIGRALDAAGVEPSEVDHANVHGTATRPNDPLECLAIRGALGRHAEAVSCSANKAQIGHLLGAAGAVELAFTALAIRDGFVPPTLHLDDPDPACDLDGTPHVGRPRDIRAAIKLSLGFGGHLAVAVLRRVEGVGRPRAAR